MNRDLASVRPGQVFHISDVPDDKVRAQFLRLGFLDGDVECRHRVSNGPVVIHRNGTELAVGNPVAKQIAIESQ